jgi:hypothetical protein
MATQYAFGKIVTNGLVLCLDAADRNSYVSGSTTWNSVVGSTAGSLINGPTFNFTNGGSIVFDGVNDYVSLGTFTGLGSTSRTISAWFRTTSTPASVNRIITFPADDSGNDIPAYTLAIAANGTIGIGIGGLPYNGYIDNIPYTLGSWVNITSTIVGNTLTYYRNSILGNSATNTGTVATNTIGYLGRYNGNYGQYLSGNIASVQLYNRALTASEVLQNFNAQKSRFGL